MTVRAWFTISAVAMVALFAAVALRLAAPTSAPAIVARVGSIRLPGALESECWPQRSGKTRCAHSSKTVKGAAALKRRGRIRVVVEYPVQPKDGYVQLSRGNHVLFRHKWSRTVSYEVDPGTYELTASAEYSKDAQIRYVFRFRAR